jgi:hypothetical protein
MLLMIAIAVVQAAASTSTRAVVVATSNVGGSYVRRNTGNSTIPSDICMAAAATPIFTQLQQSNFCLHCRASASSHSQAFSLAGLIAIPQACFQFRSVLGTALYTPIRYTHPQAPQQRTIMLPIILNFFVLQA